jgi:putative aldouronate transport system permease protein
MVTFTILGAYPLSKPYMPNRKFWTTFILISMFFNGGLIPNYFLVKYLHLTETVWSLILPGLINTFYLIVARNFIMTVPESLVEAAKIDGANEIKVLISIVLPICKPIIATVALWAAVYHWNAWFDCIIYITKPEKSVLQVVLFRIINSGSYDLVTGDFSNKQTYPEVVKACTIMVTVLPIVMVYPFLQKYFIKGMLIGSVKG